MKTIQLTPSVKATKLTLSCSLDEGRITLNENLSIVTAEGDTFETPQASLSFHATQGGQSESDTAKRAATATAVDAIYTALSAWRIAIYEADQGGQLS